MPRHDRGELESLDLASKKGPAKGMALYDQDGLVPACNRSGWGDFHRVIRAKRLRKIDLDRRTVSLFAVDFDVAARLLDEAIHHAQPEAGSLAEAFGGDERFEHLVAHRPWHAFARILYPYHHIAPAPH